MSLRSWFRRFARYEYRQSFGDPAGVSVDRHALFEIDLDHEKSSDPQDDASTTNTEAPDDSGEAR